MRKPSERRLAAVLGALIVCAVVAIGLCVWHPWTGTDGSTVDMSISDDDGTQGTAQDINDFSESDMSEDENDIVDGMYRWTPTPEEWALTWHDKIPDDYKKGALARLDDDVREEVRQAIIDLYGEEELSRYE